MRRGRRHLDVVSPGDVAVAKPQATIHSRLLDLQRLAGNRATAGWVAAHTGVPLPVQRHAASGLLNTFASGGLTNVIFTPDDGPAMVGDLSFQSGRVGGLDEVGAAAPRRPHTAPGLQNIFKSGGLTNVVFTPEGGRSTTGDISFQSGRMSGLEEVERPPKAVQRHAAQGLRNRFHSGGLTRVVWTPTDGPSVVGSISFQSGRMSDLTEVGAPGPKPAPTPTTLRTLSMAKKSRGDDVKAVQARLKLRARTWSSTATSAP